MTQQLKKFEFLLKHRRWVFDDSTMVEISAISRDQYVLLFKELDEKVKGAAIEERMYWLSLRRALTGHAQKKGYVPKMVCHLCGDIALYVVGEKGYCKFHHHDAKRLQAIESTERDRDEARAEIRYRISTGRKRTRTAV